MSHDSDEHARRSLGSPPSLRASATQQDAGLDVREAHPGVYLQRIRVGMRERRCRSAIIDPRGKFSTRTLPYNQLKTCFTTVLMNAYDTRIHHSALSLAEERSVFVFTTLLDPTEHAVLDTDDERHEADTVAS